MTLDRNGVAFVISDLGPGGAQRVISTVAGELAERGYSISMITLTDDTSDFFALPRDVRRIVMGGRVDSNGFFAAVAANLRRLWALRQALRQVGAATVVAFVGTTNILTILATIGLGTRIIISERNDPAQQSFGRPWDLMRLLLYRFADVVTANSMGALDTMSAYVPRSKLALVPNPLPKFPSDGQSVAFVTPTVLSVGRLSRQKGFDILLAAFAKVDANEDWRLAIAGEGKLAKELARQAEALGISGRIDWLGWVADPFSLYRSASIFVLASRFEGTPNALLEALACGLPCIVTDASPGPLAHIKDSENGLVVPGEDVDALAAAISRLIAKPELGRRLGQCGRERLGKVGADAIDTWIDVLQLNQLATKL